MRDVVEDINRWLSENSPIAIATVLSTWGSAPRKVGAKMAMTPSGQITGSVSGGCVEGAVFDIGQEVLFNRQPQLIKFGVADETAWDVGLACGGSIEVFVEPLDPVTHQFTASLLIENEPFAIATVIEGPREIIGRKLIIQRSGRMFGHISEIVDGIVAAATRSALASGKSIRRRMSIPDSDIAPFELFIEIVHPATTLIMIGGVHITIALSAIAKVLGYQTIVIDPRRAFGNEERFPDVDQLIQAWPQEAFQNLELTTETAIASLTHDPKIDDPAIKIALASPAFYIGALGSKKTHTERKARLRAANVPEAHLEKIHGPIGLTIGAETPEEIAVAIMAEIVAFRHHSYG